MNPGTFYSAASLLNPRAKQKQKNSSSGLANMDSDEGRARHATTPSTTPEQDVGQSALLARIHNFEDRTEHVAKRQKTSDGTASASWTGSKTVSEVSKHLKDKRAEGLALVGNDPKPSPLSGNIIKMIDTDEDDDDDDDESSEEVEESSKEDEPTSKNEVAKPQEDLDPEVCIGQIDGAQINMDKIPAVPKNTRSLTKDTWPAFYIKLKKVNPRDLRISAFDENGNDFGTLEAKYAYPVSQALAANKITRIKTLLLNRKRKHGEEIGHGVSMRVPVHVLIFCKKSSAIKLYNQLAKQKAPLRTPVGSEEQIAKLNYYDVEALQFEDGTADTLAGLKVDPAALQKLEHDVFEVLGQVHEHNDLPFKDEDSSVISTRLLDYQKQGLYFMAEQEVSGLKLLGEFDVTTPNAAGRSLWRTRIDKRGRLLFLNRATGHTQEESPHQVLGGLLADQMGLGKTLTVISLIASDIEAADDWCQEADPIWFNGNDLCNVRTTLVVAPTTVLQNWEEQLKKHVVEGGLSYLKYHGPNRLTNLKLLTDFDVIFTTYGTVQREMSWRNQRDKRNGSLFSLFNFYRIVLDEAHYIKGDNTERQRSICNLQGQRKWAITGTPIQNGLEDFGSILKFLKLGPFDRSFKQLVTLPAKRDPEVVLGRMRLVFNSITLRRTKEKLTLPSNDKHVHKIVLRDDEKLVYDRFTREVQRNINEVSKDDLSRNYMNFFSQLMSCRRMCDSIDLLSDKEKARVEDSHVQKSVENEAKTIPDLSEDDAYRQLDALHSCMAANCSRCGNGLLKDPLDGEADNEEIGRFWDCQCFICPLCSESFEKLVDEIQQGDRFVCPETDVEARVMSIKLTYKKFIKFRQSMAEQEQEGVSKIAQRYTKTSSKTEALLHYLEQERLEEVTEGLPNKAVVFTGWSNYLDLLQIDLAQRGFQYLRLDGSMTPNKRVKILEQFNADPTITVLIATIGVGGVGLNLQVANSVFIMEPQWNPATEEQAVDRVYRLGQKRAVKTVRFIVQDTVEVGVRNLALQKQALADLTTAKGHLSRADATSKVQELLSVLRR